jgi:hypothetical protein
MPLFGQPSFGGSLGLVFGSVSTNTTHTHTHLITSQHLSIPIAYTTITPSPLSQHLPSVITLSPYCHITLLSTFNHTLHTSPSSHPPHCHNTPLITPSPLSQHPSPHSHSIPHLPTTGTGGGTSYGKTGGAGGGGGGKFGSSDKCPKCGGAVYMAEKIVGAGSVRLCCCIAIVHLHLFHHTPHFLIQC